MFQSHTSLLGFVLLLISQADGTTEWFGDLRAELNPPRQAPFYDVVYDDSECPQGIHSNVIPEYVYFGEMIGTATVTSHTDCIGRCLSNKNCTATNYFLPAMLNSKAYCELLKENQYDNPKLMRPFHNAIYYEKIKCQSSEDQDVVQSAGNNFEAEDNHSNVDTMETTTKNIFVGSDDRLSKLKDSFLFMKKLASKVREFNLRFRIR
ncbi:Apple domain-containing protein [Aphelenchoides besseyi]|nr:Apple domain-containing protein [Aphelenchoides besseyi]KAI6201261.1 Apple domain-containing protein [Aphelenchoides besseyi]